MEIQEKELEVSEVMSRHLARLDASMPVTRAAKLMVTHGVGSVIVDDDGEEGILTKGDIISRVIAFGHDPGIVTVGEIATRPLVTVETTTSLQEAMTLMARNRVERLVVIERPAQGEARRIVGVISANDILRAAPGLFHIRRELMLMVHDDDTAEEGEEIYTGHCDDCGNYSTSLKTIGGYSLCPGCRIPMGEDEIEPHDDEDIC